MASAAQIRANRANSAHSTGPRTPQGIAACQGNALRHGLTSKQIILKGESAEEFDALVADLAAGYHPANAAESILVSQIAEHYWRLRRARSMETAHWEKRIAANDRFMRERNPPREHPSEARQLVAILELDDSGSLEKLARYEAAIERSYYRAIKQLEHLQLVRRKEEKQIGSVSQPEETAPAPRTVPAAPQAAMPPEPPPDPARQPLLARVADVSRPNPLPAVSWK